MSLYGGIDLHSNNSVVVLLDEQDQVIYQKRLPNRLPVILDQLGLCCINRGNANKINTLRFSAKVDNRNKFNKLSYLCTKA